MAQFQFNRSTFRQSRNKAELAKLRDNLELMLERLQSRKVAREQVERVNSQLNRVYSELLGNW